MNTIRDFGIRIWDSESSVATTGNSQIQVPKSQIPNYLLRASFFLILGALTLGATTDSDTHFNNLGHRLMCTCGCSQVLMECNHVGCQSSEHMRTELKAAMDRGGSDDQILSSFVQNYGPVVLAAPGKTGFDRVAWLMPYVVLGLGLTVTGAVVHLWKARSRTELAANSSGVRSEATDDLRRRIQEDTEI